LIPFNKPYYSGKEQANITRVMRSGIFSGEAEATKSCEKALMSKYGFDNVFLTNSCTMALEIAALLTGVGPGDEVIVPSFTYVSTANAFALRGAKIVFADSLTDDPNMDPEKVEALVTSKTKVLVVVHYAGNACRMEALVNIAKKHGLLVVEDAAQGIHSFYKDKPLGSLGHIACFSFHETKNIHCGEGGCIVINDPALVEKAEQIRNKGTNRTSFLKGEVNKYEWTSLGFSSLPNAISSAFLLAQIGNIDGVQKKRMRLWKNYEKRLQSLRAKGILVPSLQSMGNAHIFFLVCRNAVERNELIAFLKKDQIHAVFHYQSLHRSPFFKDMHSGKELPNADRYSNCLLRLPLYFDLSVRDTDLVSEKILNFYS
jgi:dTDP-4-amino-4,6-dideoxygalactose transaminase